MASNASLKLNPYNSFNKKNYHLDEIGNLWLKGGYGDYLITNNHGILDVFDKRINKQIASNLKDVSYLNFDDAKKISVESNKTYHVKDIVNIDGSGPYIITSKQLLVNDIDLNNNVFNVHKVLNPIGGTVSKGLNDEITFTPDNKYKGIKSFEYHVKNSDGVINQSNVKVYLKTPELPNDNNFFEQWYLERANIIPVWKYYTGKNVKVAVFDEGVLAPHKDIINNIESVPQFSTEHGYIPTYYMHALGVAGVIAAERNDINLVGVAYDAKIASYQLPFYDFANINLDFFKHYSIINNSWGGESLFWGNDAYDSLGKEKNKFYKAYKEATSLGREGLGSVIVFAAGNSKTEGMDANYSYLTNSPYVITVGGINKPNEQFFLESNIQKFASPGATILVSAPASKFSTLNIEDLGLDQKMSLTHEDVIKNVDGTSFAAPLVSGIIALMLEANPNLGWRDIQEILAITAKKFDDKVNNIIKSDLKDKNASEDNNSTNNVEDKQLDISKAQWLENAAKNWNGGGMHYSHEYGFGEVDAYAAVKLAEIWHSKQISKNMLTIANTNPKKINEIIKKGSLKLEMNIEEDIMIEYATFGFKLVDQDIGELEINLYSPANTKSTLLYKPGKGEELDISKFLNGSLNGDLSSTNFRGEQSIGKWVIEIKLSEVDSISTDNKWGAFLGYKYKNTLQDIDLTIYGKDIASTTLYYSDEFEKLSESNANRTTIDKNFKTINAAAVSKSVNIDLSFNTDSTISDKKLSFGLNNIVNIMSGDGDDILIGNDLNNIFAPGRGENKINTNGGNDIIYFANIGTHSGNTIINDFVLSHTKLQFGRNCKYDNIKNLITQSVGAHNTIIKAGNWSITLMGIDSKDITQDNFVFADLII
jgi:subtilisin family serine protease